MFVQVEELTDRATGGLAFPAGVIKMLDIMHTVQLDGGAGAHAAETVLAKRAVLAKVRAAQATRARLGGRSQRRAARCLDSHPTGGAIATRCSWHLTLFARAVHRC